jgi:hypothetical protein
MRLRVAALILASLWAGLWTLFEGAEAAGSRQFGQAALLLMVMVGAVAIAWRWPLAGGILLILEALAAVVLFAPMWLRRMDGGECVLLFSTMCAPPLIAGLMLILSRSSRTLPAPYVH